MARSVLAAPNVIAIGVGIPEIGSIESGRDARQPGSREAPEWASVRTALSGSVESGMWASVHTALSGSVESGMWEQVVPLIEEPAP